MTLKYADAMLPAHLSVRARAHTCPTTEVGDERLLRFEEEEWFSFPSAASIGCQAAIHHDQ